MDSPGEQKKVGGLVVGGGCLIVVGIGLFMLQSMIGFARLLAAGSGALFATASLPLLLVFIGIIMAMYGLFTGGKIAFGDNSSQPQRIEENAYVISVLCLNDRHEPVYDPEMYAPNEIRYYVQLEFQDGKKLEFETARQVTETMGEGMRGTATVQGKWLSKFVPLIGGPTNQGPEPVPYQPNAP